MKLRITFLLILIGTIFIVSSCTKEQPVEVNEDPPPPSGNAGFKIKKHVLITELPSFINIMFQVNDLDDKGVDDLITSDFEVLEDNQPVSPTESSMNIKKKDQIPYSLKTVLMLDNSASVGNSIPEIRNAAIALVNNIVSQQEIAVYKFSENTVLVQDFTGDINTLISAINSIELGYATTDLYGAIIEGVSRWQDIYSTTEIQQGFLVIFTDGSDTQGSHTLGQAINARGEKRVYTIGLGNEIEPAILKQLGNAGFFSTNDVNELTSKFTEVQNDIVLYANSFYWLNYMSPKRGDFDHTLKLIIKDNTYTGPNSYITGSFNSKYFTSSVVTLISPNGGEILKPDTTIKIEWESFNVNTVKIDLSTNSGNSWNEITVVPAATGGYNWTVPNISSNQCRVKITNVDDADVYDESNGLFSINSPPNQPSNPFPPDTSKDQSINLVLTWDSSDPDSDVLTYDVYFGTSSNPQLITNNYTTTSYNPDILAYNTKYYWKIIAKDVNNNETSSDIWSFTTKEIPCQDIQSITYEGKTYNTIQIGDQCWLKENLDVGTMIQGNEEMSDNGIIEKYAYDNDPTNLETYGGLYQWDEAMQWVTTEGTQGICPDGWHIPTLSEFIMLKDAVGGDGNALKAIGQGTGDGEGTNTSGFSALLAGHRHYYGIFYDLGYYAYFWSSTEYSATNAYGLGLYYSGSYVGQYSSTKTYGFSIRCLKD